MNINTIYRHPADLEAESMRRAAHEQRTDH